MTYQQTIDFLYSQLPMFTRIGAAAYKKDLHNTIQLLEYLGNPQQNFKSIHIAGTNGKGSTSHMLAAVMQANGFKTGLYTSPHLKDFRERIKVNGEWISESFVIAFTERMKPLIESLEPSFFEMTVAMAFEYFALEKVDIAVIETGLGGRLDSTNIILPELSIITNIGWDHMNLLGNTITAIAGEKAGIIKPGTPVVIGETTSETKPVFIAKAKLENAPIHFSEEAIAIVDYTLLADSITVDFKRKNDPFSYSTDLPGIYQQYNLRTVITAINALKEKGWDLDDVKNREALLQVKASTGLHGRWEIISKKPSIVLDVAHNEDGIRQILNQLKLILPEGIIPKMVLGMVRDKEVEKVLQILPPAYQYFFTNAQLPRAMPAEELKQKAETYGLTGSAFNAVNEALATAIKDSTETDFIIVCGSVFVVGEVDLEVFKNLSLPA